MLAMLHYTTQICLFTRIAENCFCTKDLINYFVNCRKCELQSQMRLYILINKESFSSSPISLVCAHFLPIMLEI